MLKSQEYPESFLKRIEVVGSPNISQEDSERYWLEHKANMTWGIQKALRGVDNPSEVAILGAGKCSDIRLLEIMQKGSVRDIDLYDLDAEGLEIAISYVKSRIAAIMPMAINFANFNPIVADVTFIMKDLLRRFDEIRASGPRTERDLAGGVIYALYGALGARQLPEKQYDVVVSDCILSQILVELEMQIENLRDSILKRNERTYSLWEGVEAAVHELMIEDHFGLLASMTKPGGAVFVASDNTYLCRGKVNRNHKDLLVGMKERGELPLDEQIRDFGGDYIVEEIEVPRFKYMDGNITEMAKKHMPEFEQLGEHSWEWNRDPHELQKEGTVFAGEKVQGVVLKRKQGSHEAR